MSAKVKVPSVFFQTQCALMNGFFPAKAQYTEVDYPKLDGKVVIITGASSGVGYEAAKLLLAVTNAKVYIIARNKRKIEDAIKKLQLEIAQEFNKKTINVDYVLADFSDLTTIKAAAQDFLSKETRLDIIIHNAGVMTPPPGSKTKQGYELQLGTNNLGPHLLQKYLDPIFIATSKTNKQGESRIIYTSASAHFSAPLGGIHYADPNYYNTKATPFTIYGQSKAINILSAKQWTKEHPEANNVICASLCPGFLKTDLQRYMSGFAHIVVNRLFHEPRNGAYTELFAALSPELTKVKSGSYIESFGKFATERADLQEPAAARKSWNFLEQEVAKYYEP
ncbi:short-chain alcohol dehydrogenase [Scheffersomyces amazonensis]|uniref:short-chain alcohol dehydrogenase n=1 Tax=Scheffersomyces amazonensis TaxID=1078765 RepID=UPI00315CFCE5